MLTRPGYLNLNTVTDTQGLREPGIEINFRQTTETKVLVGSIREDGTAYTNNKVLTN